MQKGLSLNTCLLFISVSLTDPPMSRSASIPSSLLEARTLSYELVGEEPFWFCWSAA